MKKKLLLLISLSILTGAGCVNKSVPVTEKIKTDISTSTVVKSSTQLSCLIPDLPPFQTSTAWFQTTSVWNDLTRKDLSFKLLYPELPSECSIINGILDQVPEEVATELNAQQGKFKNKIFLNLEFSGIYLKVQSVAYEPFNTLASDEPFDDPIKPDKIDLNKSEKELAVLLSNKFGKATSVKKVMIGNKTGVRVEEAEYELDGNPISMIYYIVPKYNNKRNLNFLLYSSTPKGSYRNFDVDVLEKVIKTVRFTD